jgi:hypothetical protein
MVLYCSVYNNEYVGSVDPYVELDPGALELTNASYEPNTVRPVARTNRADSVHPRRLSESCTELSGGLTTAHGDLEPA